MEQTGRFTGRIDDLTIGDSHIFEKFIFLNLDIHSTLCLMGDRACTDLSRICTASSADALILVRAWPALQRFRLYRINCREPLPFRFPKEKPHICSLRHPMKRVHQRYPLPIPLFQKNYAKCCVHNLIRPQFLLGIKVWRRTAP